MLLGVGMNLALLIYYKYFHFFFSGLIQSFGWDYNSSIHLPLGISFFTFQGISYIVDVYRSDAPAEKNPIHLGMYIAMFPQLIAGPIVRFKEIRSQLMDRKVTWGDLSHGIVLFVVGLAYKVVIADYLGEAADFAFGQIDNGIGWTSAWLGLFSYSFQIYYDFCGYSVMAVGLGRMVGFQLPVNFRYPYISKSVTEFWRRWHITLSEWFRDYLYIPLGGNRVGQIRLYRNLWIVFLLCGLWHGAQWTFIVWGIYHGSFLVIERMALVRQIHLVPGWARVFFTFLVVTFGWVFFRSQDAAQLSFYISQLFSFETGDLDTFFTGRYWSPYGIFIFLMAIILSTPLLSNSLATNNNWAVFSDIKHYALLKGKPIYVFFVLIIFFVSISVVLSTSYEPFIYFRF